MNLLEETEEILKLNNLTLDDVCWIEIEGKAIPDTQWESVLNIEYDDGFGGQEISTTLKVTGEDWWLDRCEYDGSEWWEFRRHPERPKTFIEKNTKIKIGTCFRW